MKMKIWWALNIVWLFIFAAGAIFIGVRKVDFAGVVQTPEIKMVSFIILGVAFLIVVLFQLILLIYFYFVRKSTVNYSTKRLSWSKNFSKPLEISGYFNEEVHVKLKYLKAFFAIIILLFGSLLMNITVQDELTKNIILKTSGFIIFFIGLKFLFTQIDLIKQKKD